MNLRKDHCSMEVFVLYSNSLVVDLVKRLKLGNNLIELITMDILALESMKNAAKCDK